MKISIITVSYNSSATILDTFESIRSQNYSDIEYIVIDGGSKDATKEMIESNSDLISKWISEPDEGIYDAMNKGIELASGEVIGILNSDDVYASYDSISNIMKCFNEEIEIVYGNIDFVSFDLNKVCRKWKSSFYKNGSFKNGWHPPHPAFFVKSSLYKMYGNFDINYKIASDFDLMLRFMEVNQSRSFFLDEVVTKMRIGGESTGSLKNIINGNKEIIEAFKKNGIKPIMFYRLRRWFKKIIQYLS